MKKILFYLWLFSLGSSLSLLSGCQDSTPNNPFQPVSVENLRYYNECLKEYEQATLYPGETREMFFQVCNSEWVEGQQE